MLLQKVTLSQEPLSLTPNDLPVTVLKTHTPIPVLKAQCYI